MTLIASTWHKLKKHRFLFEELVKRDFQKKYKRTVLGMLWSLLSPLFMLTVMALVFTQFFRPFHAALYCLHVCGQPRVQLFQGRNLGRNGFADGERRHLHKGERAQIPFSALA